MFHVSGQIRGGHKERGQEQKCCTLAGDRGQPTHPAHSSAEAIQKRIDSERLAPQPSPAQPARMRTPLLAQQDKQCSPGPCFGTGGKQPKVSHGVPAAIRYMFFQDCDKVFVRMPHSYKPIVVSRVLCQVFNVLVCNPLETVLCDRRTSNVSSDIAQEMRLGHSPTDVNVPSALVLDFENCPELRCRVFGGEDIPAQRLRQACINSVNARLPYCRRLIQRPLDSCMPPSDTRICR
jgi:hypothetical protein